MAVRSISMKFVTSRINAENGVRRMVNGVTYEKRSQGDNGTSQRTEFTFPDKEFMKQPNQSPMGALKRAQDTRRDSAP